MRAAAPNAPRRRASWASPLCATRRPPWSRRRTARWTRSSHAGPATSRPRICGLSPRRLTWRPQLDAGDQAARVGQAVRVGDADVREAGVVFVEAHAEEAHDLEEVSDRRLADTRAER